MALVLVTIILMLSAFIVPPLLQLNFSGTRSAQISEDKALRLYASDAGIEDALYQIKNGMLEGNTEKNYTVASDMNRSTVNVTINDIGSGTYRITSTATSIGGGETTIESYVAFSADYSYLTDYAAATDGELENKGTIVGDVRCGELEEKPGSSITGNVTIGDPLPSWPTAQELKDFYWEDVQGSVPYGSEELDIGVVSNVGPFYRNGDLEITGDGVLTLQGTMYITGDLEIDVNSGATIDLNGYTIFVEGEFKTKPNTSLLGPGAIIAVQELELQPKMENDGFIFLMSVEDEVKIKPNGNFNGTLAAADEIEVYPGASVINNQNPPVLNIPGMVEGGREITSIFTYNITNES